MFHVIVRGAGWIQVAGEAPRPFRSGDLLVLPHGHAHVVGDRLDGPSRDIAALAGQVGADGLRAVRTGGDGPETSILCGTFSLGPDGGELLLDLLPPLITLDGTATARWLEATVRLLSEEVSGARPGHGLLQARLAEVLFVQVLRAWSAQAGSQAGWLGALSDARLARALGRIHADPAGAWTTAALANAAGMSRSSFHQRFHEAVGEPPASYVTRWRMTLARSALRRQVGIAQVAVQVGYGSEAAFSRAFKRFVGMSPSAWRSRARAGNA